MNVANVKTHVPLILDLGIANYGKWSMLVTILLDKYELSNHVDVQNPEANRTAESNRVNFIVRSWLYDSISKEILDNIMAENRTAHDVYMLIRNLFLDNQMTRIVHLLPSSRATSPSQPTVIALRPF
jgi:hypothetical protein